ARMARETLSVEERQRRNREYQKRKEIINSQPELKEEFIRKKRRRWRKRVEEGKKINDLGERDKKQKQKESRERRKRAKEGHQSEDTPPQSPVDSTFEPRNSRQQGRGKDVKLYSNDVLVRQKEPSSPVRISSTRGIYNISS
ncbi:hypothetical protein AMECASPLE_033630, partial [Ameca splendens]